jgi:hypothetical protein
LELLSEIFNEGGFKIRFLPSTVTEKNATKNILDGRKGGQTERVKQYTPLPLR